MADFTKGKGKRRADDEPAGTKLGPGGAPEKKAKKRVRIQAETEVFGGAHVEDAMGGAGREVDDNEDLETAKARRGAVNLAGYGSESDTEDEGDAPAKGDDDDMFGDSFTEEPKRKKGDVKFLTKEEIEGQEFDQDEEYNETGVKITPFNMDEEMEEGNIDESGHYIRKKDEHQMHDNWLQGVSKSDIERAKNAHERQLARERALDALGGYDESDENQVWLNALRYMQPGETLFAAMKRLGGNKKTTSLANKWKKKKAAAMEVDEPLEDAAAAAERRQAVEQLTALSDKLMSLGQFDFQSLTYEQIVRNLRRAELLDDSWQPGDAVPDSRSAPTSALDTLWEYKWGEESEELFGPYTGQEMRAWNEQGFFNEGGALVRQVKAGTPLDAMSGFIPVGETTFV
ncbi:hypothetical protein HDV00_005569 [Rhizophlyctis rosea]|nr:hypothetical protein HDV00_005569 [Rhizophlyctis rosea]